MKFTLSSERAKLLIRTYKYNLTLKDFADAIKKQDTELAKKLKAELLLGLVRGSARSKGKMINDTIDKIFGKELI